jgi:hypothetical protein
MKKYFTLILCVVFAQTINAQCPAGEIEVDLEISTDNWGYECYWEIVPEGNSCGDGTIAFGGNTNVGCNGGGEQNVSSGGYGNNTTVFEGSWCLLEGESYDLVFVDDWGDGGSEFNVMMSGFPLYSFEGSGNGSTWTFTVLSPPEYDAGIYRIDTYGYQSTSITQATGTLFNYGSEVLTSVSIDYSLNGTLIGTETIDNLNLEGYEEYEFEMATLLDLDWGDNLLELEIASVNGQADENPTNDLLSKVLVRGNPRPNVIDGYLDATPVINIISSGADGLETPRDLAFHPTLTRFELWVVNKETENFGGSTTTYYNAGTADQDSDWRQDGNAWHFMSLPTGIDFGENENFATSPGVYDANHNGGDPFTGPALWSSDPDIYAMPSGGNGSHLDMLHVSPYSQGIAHQIDNVYWVVDGYNNDIVRYDFAHDHGPGNSFHGDAIMHRYADFSIEKDPGNHIVSHCHFDKPTGWLYVVDHGNQRVLRMLASSGEFGGVPNFGPFEDVEDYRYVVNYDWEELVTEGLSKPSGIAVIGDRMLVSDYETGNINIYSTGSVPSELLGTIETGAEGLMGITIGPWGRIWFVDADAEQIGVIEGNPLVVQEVQKNRLVCYPNPTVDHITIQTETAMERITILDEMGRTVKTVPFTGAATQFTVDMARIASGKYIAIAWLENGQRAVNSFIKE